MESSWKEEHSLRGSMITRCRNPTILDMIHIMMVGCRRWNIELGRSGTHTFYAELAAGPGALAYHFFFAFSRILCFSHYPVHIIWHTQRNTRRFHDNFLDPKFPLSRRVSEYCSSESTWFMFLCATKFSCLMGDTLFHRRPAPTAHLVYRRKGANVFAKELDENKEGW